MNNRKLAVVTGASSGIGYELARCCAKDGYSLVIAADRPEIEEAANKLRELGVDVDFLNVDLSTTQGVDMLCELIDGRQVNALLANAGHGLGRSFLDQDFENARHVLDTNVTGTLYLIHRIGRSMRTIGEGHILITGSIAGFIPGSFSAIYSGSKAFMNSFAYALRNELKDSGISVTCLMPGATETNFYERADLMDTRLGRRKMDNPKDVAKAGYQAMKNGESGTIPGIKNKLEIAVSRVIPTTLLAEINRWEFQHS